MLTPRRACPETVNRRVRENLRSERRAGSSGYEVVVGLKQTLIALEDMSYGLSPTPSRPLEM